MRSDLCLSPVYHPIEIECPILACHSERSAAASKNLRFVPLRPGWDSIAVERSANR
jgi:hypothetical protein